MTMSIQTYHNSILKPRVRIMFNPSNTKHMLDFASFLKYHTWKNGCNYYLEDPYVDIPTMIHEKITMNVLSKFMKKI